MKTKVGYVGAVRTTPFFPRIFPFIPLTYPPRAPRSFHLSGIAFSGRLSRGMDFRELPEAAALGRFHWTFGGVAIMTVMLLASWYSTGCIEQWPVSSGGSNEIESWHSQIELDKIYRH